MKVAKRMNARQLRAATMVAEDRLSDPAIAARSGCSHSTLRRWKLIPEFIAVVEKARAEFQDWIMKTGIAARHRRVEALNDSLNRLRFVVRERAEHAADDDELKKVPGARSGLVVQTAARRSAKNGDIIDAVYEVDTSLVTAMNSTLEQAAREVGDRQAPTPAKSTFVMNGCDGTVFEVIISAEDVGI